MKVVIDNTSVHDNLIWVVFYGDDSNFIDRFGDAYISKDKAIEQAAQYAIMHQHFSYERHKTFDQFKNELTKQLDQHRYASVASVEYADLNFIIYNHVGVYQLNLKD